MLYLVRKRFPDMAAPVKPLPDGVDENIDALRRANLEIYAALILCNESRNQLTTEQSLPEHWTEKARAILEGPPT